MIFIDANIFLAADNPMDVHHVNAIRLLKDVDLGKYGEPFTSDYVFNEVIGVTFRKVGKERSLFLGNQIRQTVAIFPGADYLSDAWDLFSSTRLSLNFVDCTNVIASSLSGTIATFDREFKKVKELKVIDYS